MIFIGEQMGGVVSKARLMEEAASIKRQLEDRKLVERAKGIIQKKYNTTEEDAYFRLRNQSRRLRRSMRELAEAEGLGAAKVIHPLRVAISGRSVGPGVFELAAILGKDPAACRQVFSRARQHVSAGKPRFAPAPEWPPGAGYRARAAGLGWFQARSCGQYRLLGLSRVGWAE